MQPDIFYTFVSSPFGDLGIVWQEGSAGPNVRQVLLPREAAGGEQSVRSMFPGALPGFNPRIRDLEGRLQAYLLGESVAFDVEILSLDGCPQFQQRVLMAEYNIPRGWVSTYGRIAATLGVSGAARAVGNALARNPFPIVIPCHRAVRSDGSLGGYRGGLAMKRALLKMEGVPFLTPDKVGMEKVYY